MVQIQQKTSVPSPDHEQFGELAGPNVSLRDRPIQASLPPIPQLPRGTAEELNGVNIFSPPAPQFPIAGTVPENLDVGSRVGVGVITDELRWRERHPVHGGGRMHNGVDVSAPLGTPVYAMEGGTVETAQYGYNGGAGTLVEVRTDDGSLHRYFHGQDGSLAVERGQRVERGAGIFRVGSTGDSTGPHLHFEVRDPSGKATNPLDNGYFTKGGSNSFNPIHALDAMYEGKIRTFQIGDSSPAVRRLVEQMNWLANQDPALREIGGLPVGSTYTPTIDNAVQRYGELRSVPGGMSPELLGVLRADIGRFHSTLTAYPNTEWAVARVSQPTQTRAETPQADPTLRVQAPPQPTVDPRLKEVTDALRIVSQDPTQSIGFYSNATVQRADFMPQLRKVLAAEIERISQERGQEGAALRERFKDYGLATGTAFGVDDLAALRVVQQARGLDENGKIGPRTAQYLLERTSRDHAKTSP